MLKIRILKNRKYLLASIFTLFLFIYFTASRPSVVFYEYAYDENINEKIDITTGRHSFEIHHYMTDNGKIVYSQLLSGVSLRILNYYLFIPTNNRCITECNLSIGLAGGKWAFPAYVSSLNENNGDDDDRVMLFADRGLFAFADHSYRLSSLFLGQER